MIRIYSDSEKKLKRKLMLLSLLFTVIIPILGVFLLNGTELYVYYQTEAYEMPFGEILAQSLSIINSVVSSVCFMCALVVLALSVMTFGVFKSLPAVLLSFFTVAASEISSFIVLYILICTGNHNYTLRDYSNNLPVLVDIAIIMVFVYFLVTLACLLLYFFSDSFSGNSYASHKKTKKNIKMTFIAVAALKVISYVYDLIGAFPQRITFGSVMKYIVLPPVYIALQLVACYFAVKYLIKYVDKLLLKLEIDFSNDQSTGVLLRKSRKSKKNS